MRLSLAAFVSIKLRSNDRCLPCTRPTSLPHDFLEQLLEQFRLLKPPVPALREGRVMRDRLIEAQPKPRPVNHRHARCMRTTTSLRSLVISIPWDETGRIGH
jgi:hypothetical protein